jgi:hypothetical protein
LAGIYRVRGLAQRQVHDLIDGVNDVKITILGWYLV